MSKVRAADKISSVVVGDGTVGKTSLLLHYTTGQFYDDQIPKTQATCTSNFTTDSSTYQLSLWDTAGQEVCDFVRPTSYLGADLFLICFSVNSRTSFDNVKAKWLPEVKRYVPDDCALVLVGTKADMRSEEGTEEREPLEEELEYDIKHMSSSIQLIPLGEAEYKQDRQEKTSPSLVSSREAQELVYKEGLHGYYECSAKTGVGVNHIFENAIQSAVDCREKRLKEERQSNRPILGCCTIV